MGASPTLSTLENSPELCETQLGVTSISPCRAQGIWGVYTPVTFVTGLGLFSKVDNSWGFRADQAGGKTDHGHQEMNI